MALDTLGAFETVMNQHIYDQLCAGAGTCHESSGKLTSSKHALTARSAHATLEQVTLALTVPLDCSIGGDRCISASLQFWV